MKDQLGKLPLSFQENEGQVDEVVKYLVKNGSTTIFFTPEEVVYNMVQREAKPPQDPKSMKGPHIPEEGDAKGAVIRQSFEGADKTPEISGENELQGKVNYMVGNDRSKWLKGLRTFGTVRYESLYPGIDLVYSGMSSQLNYRYEIESGVDYKILRVKLAGIDSLSIDQSGNLVMKNSLGNVLLKKPVATQEKDGKKEELVSRYVMLDKDVYGFEITGFDPNLPLVIETK